MVFRLLQNGVAAPLNVFATARRNPATGQKEIWANFMGAPSVVFRVGGSAGRHCDTGDFNASASAYLRSLWNGVLGSGTGGR